MFNRILVPVDGSPTSNKALVAALQLARESGTEARMRLVHVIEDTSWMIAGDAYGGANCDLIEILKDSGTRILNDALAIAQSAGVSTDTVLFDGMGNRLGETIVKACVDWNADLVVVGTHGRHGLSRVFLGSGAEQVVRLAPVPVLVVRTPPESQTK
jgi:nucleotide-binding universal stress UspA family protein